MLPIVLLGSPVNPLMLTRVAKIIDAEVAKIINESYQRAKQVLSEKRKRLEELARTLLEKETLEGEELKKLLYHS